MNQRNSLLLLANLSTPRGTDSISMVQWLVVRYAIFNIEVIQAAIKIAKQEGVSVSLDLASFEVIPLATLKFLEC